MNSKITDYQKKANKLQRKISDKNKITFKKQVYLSKKEVHNNK